MRTAFACPSLLLVTLAARLVAQDGNGGGPVTPAPEGGATPPYSLQIVHINQAGHATNLVPGLGIPFKAGGGDAIAFERPYLSAGGAFFAMHVISSAATTSDEVLLLNGVPVLVEGSPVPWAPGENAGILDADFAINDLGELLINHNTSPTTLDDYVVKYSAGSWTVLAQEGQSTPVGGTWGSTMDSVALANTGDAGWRGLTIATLPTATNAVVVTGASLLQKGVDVPIAQAGGATNTWENFTADAVRVSPDGSLWLVQGDTNGATTGDLVLTLNNVVAIQEGQVLPGSSFATGVSTIARSWIDRSGNWWARGSVATSNDDWLVRNGVLIADSSGSSEVVPGSGEFWDDATFAACFFAMDGNALGQFVFGGVTSAPSATNGVLVFGDTTGFRRVLVREGDPIDVNGNGLFDDDRFFNTFGNDDVLLLDDGTVLFVATVKNGAGTAVEQGLFRLVPIGPSCTFRNGSGVNPAAFSCVTLPVLGGTWTANVAATPTTLLTGLFISQGAIPAFPLGAYELLVDPFTWFDVLGYVTHTVAVPSSPQFLGYDAFVQGVRVEVVGPDLVIELTNAQDLVIGL